VLTKQIRAIALGFLALLAIGSLAASAAYGEAGPFWHHREKGGKGVGEKIEEKAPERIEAKGGEKKLKSIFSETKVSIVAKSLQAEGILYNNALQGQLKVRVKLNEPTLVEPVLKGCEVKVGENNEYKAEGHLMWKWNGEKKQLEEASQKAQKYDVVLTPTPIEPGATELPKATLTTITLKGAGCGVLTGTFKITGGVSALAKPAELEEWSSQLNLHFPGWSKQHFWNGKEFIGVEPKLEFGGGAATLEGNVEGTISAQEIAVFEK
jgi:hypothetical protein